MEFFHNPAYPNTGRVPCVSILCLGLMLLGVLRLPSSLPLATGKSSSRDREWCCGAPRFPCIPAPPLCVLLLFGFHSLPCPERKKKKNILVMIVLLMQTMISPLVIAGLLSPAVTQFAIAFVCCRREVSMCLRKHWVSGTHSHPVHVIVQRVRSSTLP